MALSRVNVFWDVTPYRWVNVSRRFEGTQHLRLAGSGRLEEILPGPLDRLQ